MGKACCGSKNVKYEYEGKTKKMSIKSANTIERYAQGAAARNQVSKLKTQMAQDIATLPKPTYEDPLPKKSKDRMMNQKEFDKFMTAPENKNLVWNNYYEEIDKNRQYRGQWTKDRAHW